MKQRFNVKPWRHDAYTLTHLQKAFQRAADRLTRSGVLHPDRSMVLDFGAGEAPYRTLFEAVARQYIACDLEAGPEIDLVFEEGHPLAVDSGSADCVVSIQVLEHVWDIDSYLKECRRCLSPNGRLIISTHGTWLYHPHPGDYRRWTRDGLIREVTARGFHVESVEAVVGPLAWTTQFRTLAYHHVLSHSGVIGRAISRLLCTFMFLRMTIEDRITPASLRESNAAVYVVVARLNAV